MSGDAPAVHLGRTVIDAKRTDLAKQARHDRVVGDAEAAKDLHAAVDNPPDRFRANHLRHARLVPPAPALVENPSGVPDDEAALVDVHLIVGEHEAHPLVLADRLAEGGAAPRVIDSNVMGAAGG